LRQHADAPHASPICQPNGVRFHPTSQAQFDGVHLTVAGGIPLPRAVSLRQLLQRTYAPLAARWPGTGSSRVRQVIIVNNAIESSMTRSKRSLQASTSRFTAQKSGLGRVRIVVRQSPEGRGLAGSRCVSETSYVAHTGSDVVKRWPQPGSSARGVRHRSAECRYTTRGVGSEALQGGAHLGQFSFRIALLHTYFEIGARHGLSFAPNHSACRWSRLN
jgi:hypothetical protein